jgi:hypothetical protein
MFFTADRNSWSESHVLTAATDRGAAEGAAVSVAQARAALLGTGARIIGVRVGQVGSRRDAHLINMGAPTLEAPNFTNPVEGQTTSDSPHVAVLVRGGNNDSGGIWHATHAYLSGVPDALITIRGSLPQFVPTPQWNTRWAAFRQALNDASAGFIATRHNDPFIVNSLVQSNVPPGEVGMRVNTAGGLPSSGDYVYLKGFKTASPFSRPLKGKYQVSLVVPPVSPDTQTTIYLRGTGGIDPTTFVQMGTFYTKETIALEYRDYNPVGATHRDRGGSYGLQRGRSRAKAR